MNDTIILTLQTTATVDRAGFKRAKAAGLTDDALSDLLDDVNDADMIVSIIEPDGTTSTVKGSNQ